MSYQKTEMSNVGVRLDSKREVELYGASVACVVRICPDQQAAKKANYPGACAPRAQRLHVTVQSSPCSTQDMVRFVSHTVCLSVYSLPAFADLHLRVCKHNQSFF
jgi:hypothetical protein